MSSIITITFNPAIDKSTSVFGVIPEKKLECASPVYEPGGGGINVARAIKRLGGEAVALYLGGGENGDKLSQLLSDEYVTGIAVRTENVTRENLIVLDKSNNKQYRFGMPGPTINEHEWQECLDNLQNMRNVNYIVASGSLPPGVPVDIFKKIEVIATGKKARLIVDTSGEALKQVVETGVYLIKPNLKELASLVGKEELSIDSVYDAARELIDNGNCEVVVVSLGSAGALLVTKELGVQIIPPLVDMKSTVGAGDCMVAGLVLSLSKNKGLTEAVQYGVACGTAATMNAGTGLCKPADVEHLFKSIQNKIPVLF